MQAIENIPTVTFPRSVSPLVLEGGEIQQGKRNLIYLVFSNLHHDLRDSLIRPVTVCNPIGTALEAVSYGSQESQSELSPHRTG